MDFDNTIVCFDPLFYSVARQQELIPAHVGSSKTDVRDHLRSLGRDDDWTRLQGEIYGRFIGEAQPFTGVKDFFKKADHQGAAVFVVSHKTRQSAFPPFYDLHEPARVWLKNQGFYKDTALQSTNVFFETSQEGKLGRLKELRCDCFIDDLLEFLSRPDFPAGVRRILFDPQGHHRDSAYEPVSAWKEVEDKLWHA